MVKTSDVTGTDDHECKLTEQELAVVQQYQKNLTDLDNQFKGAINTIAQLHGLTGNWDFRGDRYVKVEEKK